jgi:tetratricopeptide (TPR) repeat protein
MQESCLLILTHLSFAPSVWMDVKLYSKNILSQYHISLADSIIYIASLLRIAVVEQRTAGSLVTLSVTPAVAECMNALLQPGDRLHTINFWAKMLIEVLETDATVMIPKVTSYQNSTIPLAVEFAKQVAPLLPVIKKESQHEVHSSVVHFFYYFGRVSEAQQQYASAAMYYRYAHEVYTLHRNDEQYCEEYINLYNSSEISNDSNDRDPAVIEQLQSIAKVVDSIYIEEETEANGVKTVSRRCILGEWHRATIDFDRPFAMSTTAILEALARMQFAIGNLTDARRSYALSAQIKGRAAAVDLVSLSLPLRSVPQITFLLGDLNRGIKSLSTCPVFVDGSVRSNIQLVKCYSLLANAFLSIENYTEVNDYLVKEQKAVNSLKESGTVVDLPEMLNDFGRLLSAYGNMEPARRRHETALKKYQDMYGPNHHDVALTMAYLASTNHSLPLFEKALALALNISVSAEKNLYAAYIYRLMGQSQLAMTKYVDSLTSYQSALSIFSALLPENSHEILETKRLIAVLHFDIGFPALALPVLEDVRRKYELKGDKIPPIVLCRVDLDLIKAHRVFVKNQTEAYAVWERANATLAPLFKSPTPITFQLQYEYAQLMTVKGNVSLAIQIYKEIIRSAESFKFYSIAMSARQSLGSAYIRGVSHTDFRLPADEVLAFVSESWQMVNKSYFACNCIAFSFILTIAAKNYSTLDPSILDEFLTQRPDCREALYRHMIHAFKRKEQISQTFYDQILHHVRHSHYVSNLPLYELYAIAGVKEQTLLDALLYPQQYHLGVFNMGVVRYLSLLAHHPLTSSMNPYKLLKEA